MMQQHYGIAPSQILLFITVDFFSLKMCLVRNKLAYICILLAHDSGISLCHTAYKLTSKFAQDAILFRQEISCSSLFSLRGNILIFLSDGIFKLPE